MRNNSASMDPIETQTVLLLDLRHLGTFLKRHQITREKVQDTRNIRRTKEVPELILGLMSL
jgi:hypothetical protein